MLELNIEEDLNIANWQRMRGKILYCNIYDIMYGLEDCQSFCKVLFVFSQRTYVSDLHHLKDSYLAAKLLVANKPQNLPQL